LCLRAAPIARTGSGRSMTQRPISSRSSIGLPCVWRPQLDSNPKGNTIRRLGSSRTPALRAGCHRDFIPGNCRGGSL
jgi:hypothetical protein